MKVLVWSDVYPPRHGGLEKMVQTLAHGLAARGHTVMVVTSHFDGGEPLPSQTWDGLVEVRRFPLQPALLANDTRTILKTMRDVSRLKQAFQPDVVHVQSEAPGALMHMSTLAAWPCPTLLTLHGESRQFPAGQGTLLGKLFQDAAHISTVSQCVLDALHASVPASRGKSSVIYNAISQTPIPSKVEPRAEPVLFAAGRLSPEKGFDVLLEALQRVCRQLPDTRLVLAGDGPGEAALRERSAQLGMERRVSFPGWLLDHDLQRHMANAAVVVVPSRAAESFGLVALEAALLGLPVVATRVGGLQEVVADGVTGTLVPPDDPDALGDAILDLLRSPAVRHQFGQAARARAAHLFNYNSMLDRYEAMYRNTVAPQPAPHAPQIEALHR